MADSIAETYERERQELAVVLKSEPFRRSPLLSRLLTYLCEQYFEGRSQEIKEYTIAVDVLGRNEDFDPQIDSIVRVDTHLLRKRLKQYYAGEGQDHELQVVIPGGHYVPEFVVRREASTLESEPDPTQEALPETAVVPILEPSLDLAAPEAESAIEVVPRHADVPVIPSRNAAIWWTAAAALGLLAGAFWFLRPGVHQALPSRPPVVEAAAPEAAAISVPIDTSNDIRILAGDRKGPYSDRAGRVWQADHFFKGGAPFHRAFEIARTADPEIFQSGREGWFLYDIPLKPGAYELHLYFAETGVRAEGMRSINVAINNVPSSNLDIASDAGGVNTATYKIFKNVSPAADGLLHLTFPDPSFLNAIEILPTNVTKLRPIRLTTSETPYKDKAGNVWLPDGSVAGGRRSGRSAPIQGTSEPDLYQTQRFGHFTYSIPVVEGGKYTVRLHFAETWFGTSHAPGGPGSRVFDVYCNGTTLLSNFDILKEGPSNRAVVKTYRGVPASPQGKLNLEFSPRANYALINAIEIVEE